MSAAVSKRVLASKLILLIAATSISLSAVYSQDSKGYAPVNGLKMYYEIHGKGQPVILLHGAYSGIGTSFGLIWPELAKSRQVIAIEFQGHGRTADIDRDITYEQLADDVAALIRYLKLDKVDVFGYSMGAATGLQVAIRHPSLVRKLVLISASFNTAGWQPGAYDMIKTVTPEMFEGSPFKKEYDSLAPDPKKWPVLVAKMKKLDGQIQDWKPETIKAIKSPALLIFGDSDFVTPEHAIQLFRLFGGGVMGDMAGLCKSQLAILPASSHVGVMFQGKYLLGMVPAFLDAK